MRMASRLTANSLPPLALGKRRAVGWAIFAVLLALFVSLNRLPKLDTVDADLTVVSGTEAPCFQGFCAEAPSDTSLLSAWWEFSTAYFGLVAAGMVFAFLVAGLAETFLFPSSAGAPRPPRGAIARTAKGLAMGPVLNLCSACIVPISTAYRRGGGGIGGAVAVVQGSATLNIPALAMTFFVFGPALGVNRLAVALLGGLALGPLVAWAAQRDASRAEDEPGVGVAGPETDEPPLADAFKDWMKASLGYALRLTPIMVGAGLVSGLVVQWLNTGTVEQYLGNTLTAVLIAATVGVLINVPLLFEIPLVMVLLLLGMGPAPAAALLFTSAAAGPVTFAGLRGVMPARAVAVFAGGTWALGVLGGVAMLGLVALAWPSGLETEGAAGTAAEGEARVWPQVFEDATATAGIDFIHNAYPDELLEIGGGVVVLDFNGDGLQDVFLANSSGPNALYRNDGNGALTEVARQAGVDDPTGRGNGGCAADYDNDGLQDLYATNYGPSRLFKGSGDAFSDVTGAAGLREPAGRVYRSTGCAWGDYDRDGHLDLVVTRHLHEWSPDMMKTEEFAAGASGLALYRNNGDGTFTDVTSILGDESRTEGDSDAGLSSKVFAAGFQPAWVDFDDDGDLDLYTVNDMGEQLQANVLWRNDGSTSSPRTEGEDGGWRFTDVSQRSRADVPMYGMGLAAGDYNLDGHIDLFITDISDNVLLTSLGDGLAFTERARETGVAKGVIGRKLRVSWGAVAFDYDNDGDEDIYAVSGFLRGDPLPINPREQPNLLLQNRGDGTFADVSLGSGADDSGVGRGAAYLDVDNDGCLDVVTTAYGGPARLLKGVCDPDNGWLAIRLAGTSGNRDGVGARIAVTVAGKTQIREIAAGSSSMGQNTLVAHFGLGAASEAETVTVRWPSGSTQTLMNVKAGQTLIVVKPDE